MATGFLPYGRQTIEQDDIDAVVQALRGDYLTTGPWVERFERALAEVVAADHAVAVSNGTAALHAAMFAAGLGPGDEVLVPAITFLATANAALYVGARPVFVDVEPDTGLMDLDDMVSKITDRTRAVVPVHLTGRPVQLGLLRAALNDAGVSDRVDVIEDAAHALGATIGGSPIGSGEHGAGMAIFSFHPVKHVTTGEGGAVVTNDPELAARLRIFRNHGMVRSPELMDARPPGPWYYEMKALGMNYRITDIQCALGLNQLGKLPRFLGARRRLAALYDRLLAEVPHVTPLATGGQGGLPTESAYHIYVVAIDFPRLGLDRGAVMEALASRGIGTQVHYIPIPMQPYYRDLGWDAAGFPGALSYYERALTLPLFPAMSDGDVERVVSTLKDVLLHARGAGSSPTRWEPPTRVRLRPAAPDDRDMVFRWANDPGTRKGSLSTATIPYEDHVTWFADTLSGVAGRVLYIAELEGEPVGTFRIHLSGWAPGWAEVGVVVAPEHRGKGLAARIIEQGSRVAADRGLRHLVAIVRRDNPRSQRAFTRAGYELVRDTEEKGVPVLEYRKRVRRLPL